MKTVLHLHTLTVIFPDLYSWSGCGSRAGRRENSNPSMSFQSSAWPSRVIRPGLNSASTRISELDSQLHSPDSWCELTRPIETESMNITTTSNCSSTNGFRSIFELSELWELNGVCFVFAIVVLVSVLRGVAWRGVLGLNLLERSCTLALAVVVLNFHHFQMLAVYIKLIVAATLILIKIGRLNKTYVKTFHTFCNDLYAFYFVLINS